MYRMENPEQEEFIQNYVKEFSKRIAWMKDQMIRQAMRNGCPTCKRFQPIDAFVFIRDGIEPVKITHSDSTKILYILKLGCEDCMGVNL